MEQQPQAETKTKNYKMAFPTTKGTYFFLPDQIVRLEARSNYTLIYFFNHNPLLTSKVLKDYETILGPYGFIRTHRSHLVNKKLVIEIENQNKVIMQDLSKAEISRRKKNEVIKALRAKVKADSPHRHSFQPFALSFHSCAGQKSRK